MRNEHNFKEQYAQAKQSNLSPYFREQVLNVEVIMQFERVTFWIGMAGIDLTKTQRKKILKDVNFETCFNVEYELGEDGRLIYCNVMSKYEIY